MTLVALAGQPDEVKKESEGKAKKGTKSEKGGEGEGGGKEKDRDSDSPQDAKMEPKEEEPGHMTWKPKKEEAGGGDGGGKRRREEEGADGDEAKPAVKKARVVEKVKMQPGLDRILKLGRFSDDDLIAEMQKHGGKVGGRRVGRARRRAGVRPPGLPCAPLEQ